MAIISKRIQTSLIISAISLLCGSGLLNSSTKKPHVVIDKQFSAININQNLLRIFSMGQHRLLSDFLWISTLLESDLKHYQQKDKNSWMYLRFDTITALDPYFLEAYQFGGKYLSIVKDDLEGSRLIFEKGITYYPDNYDLLFNYGFLLAFELNEFKLAHKVYKKVATFPQSPNFIKTLLNKVLFEANQDLNEIFSILSEIYEKEAEDSPLKSKLKHDLYAVRAQIDLECLNMHKQNCNTKDIDGVYYEFRDGKYTSVYKFTPYRLNKNR